MQRSKSSVSIKLAVLTAALALGATAYAATGDSAPALVTTQASTIAISPESADKAAAGHHKHGRHHKSMHGHHMRDAALVVPGYGPLRTKFVESLALTDTQTKLVKEAQTEQKDARNARREAMKTARIDRTEQAKNGKLDPAAALKQADKAHEQAREERSKLNGKWLAVWDALDETQQTKIAAHFNERAERHAKHGEERAKKHGQRGGDSKPAQISS